MKITVDDSTKEALAASLKERSKSAVRIEIQGFGWGGPSFGIVLDEQKDTDEVLMIGELKIVADKEFSFLLENAKIITTKGFFGNSFNIIVGNSMPGSCS